MNYLKPLRLHFYGYRHIYFIFCLALFVGTILISFLTNVAPKTLIYWSLFLSFLFSLYIGNYEYTIISDSYLSLKINRRNFFVSSIIFCLIHTLLLLLLNFFILLFLYLFKDKSLILNNFLYYVSIFAFSFFTYVIGNFYSLYLKKFTWFRHIFFILIIIALILYGKEIYLFIAKVMMEIVDTTPKVIFSLKIIILGFFMFLTLNYIKFTIKY